MSMFSSLPTAPRRRLVVSMLGVTMAALAGGCATATAARPAGVEMAIIDRETGRPLQVYRKHGTDHVAGEPRARYAIRIVNRSAGRRLVVLAVDGINVISGATAGWNQTGYVLGPWQTFDITGWRKSDDEVAAFEFAALRDSYAARTGRPDNVGVIGMAVFAERSSPPALLEPSPAPRRAPSSAPEAKSQGDQARESPASGAAADRAFGERLGTGHGRREWSRVGRTSFERLSSTPEAVVEIVYDSHQNLVAAGIIRPHLAQARPNAFPLDAAGERFVPDPPPR